MRKSSAVAAIVLCLGALLPGCSDAGTPPTASFDASVTNGQTPLTVAFSDSSGSGGSAITGWLWEFGDGAISTDASPSHIYTAAGIFTVSLRVTTSAGSDVETRAGFITVRQAGVWYVKPGGTGDGTSWEQAFGSVQDGVDAANNEDGGEVWVAGGMYAEHVGTVATSYPTDDGVESLVFQYTVSLVDNVALYGGFAGNEVTRDARDWQTHRSVIDGEGERVCVYNFDRENVILDGLVFQNGYGQTGAALYNMQSSPTVANCVFFNNRAETDLIDSALGNGGAMLNCGSWPTVTNCAFVGNAARWGGAMFNDAHSAPAVTACTFVGNTATTGGAIFNNAASTPTLTNCLFAENVTSFSGGAVFNNACAPVLFFNCTFAYNEAISGSGGAMSNAGSTASLSNCILWGNAAREHNELAATGGGSTSVTFSCLAGGYFGLGNIESDPLFAAPETGDYSPHAGSPCINSGTATGAPPADIVGTPRPRGAGIDMGAYEHPGV